MSYFCAVIGRHGPRWRALDVELDDLETLEDLAEQLRSTDHTGPVVAVIEHEDEWFALIRADEDDDDLRVFISDYGASQRGHYATLLAPVGDVELDEYEHLRFASDATGSDSDGGAGASPDGDPDDADDPVDEDPLMAEAEADLAAAAVEVQQPLPWAGDPGVLVDYGVDADELVALVVESPNDPSSVVDDLGERCGFDELLEALR